MKRDRKPTEFTKTTSGFSLFEAIVAVTLLGIALVPILTLLSQSATQLTLASDANARSFARLATLEFMEAVNPLARPTGEADLVGFQITWDTTEIAPPVLPEARTAGLRGYELGWFEVSVDLITVDDELFDTLALKKVGYRRVDATNPFSAVNR